MFRYARKAWYAVASAAGMYIGHFMAWICASLLFAYQLHLDPGNADVHPGPLAYDAAGLTGLLCVVIAGWTTANPTIYRAGLAFQAILPKHSRFFITLATGICATIAAAAYPKVTMRLLDFVAIWALILMPMGAVIFVDFWLIRKFGLRSNWAQWSGRAFNWAAGLAWLLTLTVCTLLVQFSTVADWLAAKGLLNVSPERMQWLKETFTIEIFFVSLPGWFMTAILYLALSKWYQSTSRPAVEGGQ